MQTVHVRVNDAETGKPTPCRVRFTDAGGKYHAPLGRLSDFPSDLTSFAEGNVQDGSEAWAYIDGTCEIELPPGPISVKVRKGLEYAPLDTTVELVAGKLAMRFTLERWADWRGRGWFSGDGRVHGGSPHEYLLQAAAEDLAVVNLLAEQTPVAVRPAPGSPLMPNIVAFSGQQPCLEMPGHMVVVNTHNVDPQWGSLGLLHCHRVVYPLRIDESTVGDWTLADWCDQCHRKQGLVVWTDFLMRDEPLLCETLADLILGKVDAVELGADLSPAAWFTLLDAGFPVPLIGSSGARTNGQVIGRPRTFCYLGQAESLTYRSWIEAVRQGRTFVTQGPLVDFTVNGQPPGSIVVLGGEEKTVTIAAQVESSIPCETLVLQGRPGAGTPIVLAPDTPSAELPIHEDGWMLLHCRGSQGEPLAITSPVHVRRLGRPSSRRRNALKILEDTLGRLLERARNRQRINGRLVHVLEEAADRLRFALAGSLGTS